MNGLGPREGSESRLRVVACHSGTPKDFVIELSTTIDEMTENPIILNADLIVQIEPASICLATDFGRPQTFTVEGLT